MNKKNIHIKLITTAIAGVLMALPAYADQSEHAKGKSTAKGKGLSDFILAPAFRPAEKDHLPVWVQNKVSYSQAKSAALSRYPGAKYIDMYLDGNVYRVKLMLRNNRVVEVVVDAATGRVR